MKIAYILDCRFLFYLFAIILNFYREAEISPSPTFATVCCLFPTQAAKNAKLQPSSNKNTKLHLRETSKKILIQFSGDQNSRPHCSKKISTQTSKKSQPCPPEPTDQITYSGKMKSKDKLPSPKWRSRTTELFVLP